MRLDSQKQNELKNYLDAYSFVEFSSGKTIINLLKTVELMKTIYYNLFNRYSTSEPKFFVLLLLSNSKNGMPLSQIGKKLLVSRANITGLIDRMEKEGLVEKKGNPADKRSIKAHLTAKGKRLFEEVKKPHMEFSEKMTQCLSETEKSQLNFLLEKIQHHIVSEF